MTLIKPSLLQLIVGVSLTGITAGLLYLLLGKDEDDVEEFVQRIKTSRSATIEVKIPKDCVGVVIGRGGANIKEIQDKSETKINFKDEQVDENYRVCVIRGSPEAAQLAESLIHEFISNQPLIEVSSMLVPQQACGRIIGKSGENIRSISRASSAKIVVENNSTSDGASASGPFRRVLIKGTGDQIEIAKALIQEKVEEDAEVRRKNESLNLRQTRRDNGHYLTAGPDVQQQQNEAEATEKLAAVSSDKTVEVFVSAVSSPSTFWVQLYGPKAVELDFLVDRMTEYYNKTENQEIHAIKSPLHVNQMVAAPFNFDQKWYRAKIVVVEEDEYNPNDSNIEVYYVDWGDTNKVKQSSLYRLRTEFLQLCFQAIECSLANVIPKGTEKWSNEAIDAFETLVGVANWRKLTARVSSYQPGQGHGTLYSGLHAACIELFDTKGSEDISVAEELVKQGYAEWKKTSESRNANISKSPRASASASPYGSRLSIASDKGIVEPSNTCGSHLNVGGKKDDCTLTNGVHHSIVTPEVVQDDSETKDTQREKDLTNESLSNKHNSCYEAKLSHDSVPVAKYVLPPLKQSTGSSSPGYLPAEALSDDDDDDDEDEDGFDAP